MTGVANIHGINKVGAYAHFPGSGPAGKSCAGCAHIRQMERSKAAVSCGKYAAMKGVSPQKAPRIVASSDACKYFEAPTSA